MMFKKSFLLAGLAASLATPFMLSTQVAASTAAQSIAQRTAPTPPQRGREEPTDFCVALQEVSTGNTEIRKRIENRVIAQGNWNTDFLVPANQQLSYFVAVITPENDGSYEFTANMRHADGTVETPFTIRSGLTRMQTYSVPFQSATGRQPTLINARVGGTNGNVYTISIAGCR